MPGARIDRSRRDLAAVLAASCAIAVPLASQPPVPADDLPRALFSTAVPAGLPARVAPADSPFTADRFALGRRLFFDPILSGPRTVACATCHPPRSGFASPAPRPLGAHGRPAPRHAPTLLNRAWSTHQLWDGRAATLEQQVLLPIANPNEMDLPVAEAVARLGADPDYRARFGAVFDAEPNQRDLARALATFVRGLTIGDSPVDRFQAGDRTALTRSEKLGLWIYESKGQCWRCHSGPNFTDEAFHNTGVGAVDGRPEPGREAVTGREEDRGAWKTPTLRGLQHTAPYMHDGSLESLPDVVAFYSRGGQANPWLDRRMEPLDLTDREAGHLVAFLRALSRPADRSEPSSPNDQEYR